ncbi:MAG: hypothetical protein ACE5R6_21440 [Candidatus Heimdallarchaeota archaeon]
MWVIIFEIIDIMPGSSHRAHASRTIIFIALSEPVFVHPTSWVVFNGHFLEA